MKDPYQVLGLPAGADGAAVRKRYLELIRQHSPERSGERFAEIRAAYDCLRDPVQRLENEIFETCDHDSLDDIIAVVHDRLRETRIPVDALLSLAESAPAPPRPRR